MTEGREIDRGLERYRGYLYVLARLCLGAGSGAGSILRTWSSRLY